jgi:hypothetical protein
MFGVYDPSERKVVRLLLDPDIQGMHSRARKFMLRNPDVAAGGASEQHGTDAILFGTQIVNTVRIENLRVLPRYLGSCRIDRILNDVTIAEIELKQETQELILPNWVGKEVTGDPFYKKINMRARALEAVGPNVLT